MRKNRSLATGAYAAARQAKSLAQGKFFVSTLTSMSDSEGEQQRTKKDEVSQLVAELARQILRVMQSQKQISPASSGSTGKESTSKGKLLPYGVPYVSKLKNKRVFIYPARNIQIQQDL